MRCFRLLFAMVAVSPLLVNGVTLRRSLMDNEDQEVDDYQVVAGS